MTQATPASRLHRLTHTPPPTSEETWAANEAELLYADREITASEYLHRTRHLFLYELEQAILDSLVSIIRADLTISRAYRIGLLKK